MTATLHARDVRVRLGPALVLDGVTFTVAPGDRVGIVGPNGVGKTTLLRALAGDVPLAGGSITLLPPTAAIGYLPQEPLRSPDETVLAVLRRRTGVAAAERELEAATAALARHEPGADGRYSAALERWLALGGADLEARVGEVCAEVGLTEQLVDAPTATLSGGQAARVSLASILLSRFDLFLFDEPTNDLDFDGLARLETFVQDLRAGAVIVSHDRRFLEHTVTSVVEIDEHKRQGTEYRVGWSEFLAERALARQHAEEEYERYAAKRETLAERARRQREWATKGLARAKKRPTDKDKFIRHYKVVQTERLAAKARATERAMERLQPVEKPWEGWTLHMELAAAPRSGTIVARMQGSVIRRGRFELGPLDVEITWGERVALLGPNGSGKTTLLDALLGRLPLAAGERWFGPSVVVGELGQQRDRFASGTALLDVFIAASGQQPHEARSLLAKFGLGAEHVVRPAQSLSPGERTRAELALLMARGVNWLVLDEPTNHLDLPAIEQLERALAEWKGTLLVVTHDRQFLQALEVDRTIELSPAA